jgi:hypothetical protein
MDIENINLRLEQVVNDSSYLDDLARANHQFGYGYNKSDKTGERKGMFANTKRSIRGLAKEEEEGYNGYTEIGY